ncbi:MAG: FMN-binding protein [Lachnospiraceae bacterium]|nr:FMN-binding protein [Lachnospiraceae bacterium]
MAEQSTYKEYIYPVIILAVICAVTTALLAVTNFFSKPVIDRNLAESARQTRLELLPGADDFQDDTSNAGTLASNEKARVTEVFAASNGSGYVYTVKSKSFGGEMTMMVGIGKDGAVTGVKVTEHADTPGVGTKDHDPSYLAQYVGKSILESENVKKEPDFDFITGASVTGTAVHEGVYAALEQYREGR